MINLYCDGACSGNPGPGGWAFIIQADFLNGKNYAEAAYEENTTNNRMEIRACIEGLSEIYSFGRLNGDDITVITDSQYVVNTMTKGWARNKNQDLWEELDSTINIIENVAGSKVHWQWVKGHSTNKYNQKCDKMAVNAYKNREIKSIENKFSPNDEINISFKHIQTYTYSNQVIDIYEYKNKRGNSYYVSELNSKELIHIGDNLKRVQEETEKIVSPLK